MLSQIWLVIQALMAIIPSIVQAVQEGKIKTATLDEVQLALAVRQSTRVAAAEAAAKEIPDENIDPNNRSRTDA